MNQEQDITKLFELAGREYAETATERAIPSVLDGLKPVQRRIFVTLFSQDDLDRFLKVAAIVGATMMNFHPHGNSSISGAICKLGQEFSQRYPFIEPQGNFGSIDGDSPAADRYIEAKLSQICRSLALPYREETVTHEINWMNLKVPVFLPFLLPNILLNGAHGIGFGSACSIPPHNIFDVIATLLYAIDNFKTLDNSHISQLLPLLKGPDLPLGNIVLSDNLEECYKTGSGGIKIYSDTVIENDKIVITSVPYQQYRSSIVFGIAEKIDKGELPGAVTVRDESNLEHPVRVVILLAESANIPLLMSILYKTVLHRSFHYNIFLRNKNGKAESMGLVAILQSHIEMLIDYFSKTFTYDIKTMRKRMFSIDSVFTLKQHYRTIISVISKISKEEAFKVLVEKIKDFSMERFNEILAIPIKSIARLDLERLEKEYSEKKSEIERLSEILSSQDNILAEIKRRVIEYRSKLHKFGNLVVRRTKLIKSYEFIYSKQLEVNKDEVLLFLTSKNFLFKVDRSQIVSSSNYDKKGLRLQYRPAFGKLSSGKIIRNDEMCLLFQDNGNVLPVAVNSIPFFDEKKLLSAQEISGDKTLGNVISILPFSSNNQDFIIFTKMGYVVRVRRDSFSNRQCRAARLRNNDNVIDVCSIASNSSDYLMCLLSNGNIVKRSSKTIRVLSRGSLGVKFAKLDKHNFATNGTIVQENEKLFILSKLGYIKKIDPEKIRTTKSAGKGVKCFNAKGKGGTISTIFCAKDDENGIFFTPENRILDFQLNKIPFRQSKSALGVKSSIQSVIAIGIKNS